MVDISANGGFTSIEDVNLDDDEACLKAVGSLDSPRTLEAIRMLGLSKEELLPVNYEE